MTVGVLLICIKGNAFSYSNEYHQVGGWGGWRLRAFSVIQKAHCLFRPENQQVIYSRAAAVGGRVGWGGVGRQAILVWLNLLSKF